VQWIQKYRLVLFDFDGLLVNTESLHFKAYQRMCKNRGYELTWDWATYCYAAHHEPTRLREMLYSTFPNLKKEEPDWQVLYAEKKTAYLSLLREGAVELMPGVKNLIEALHRQGTLSCVVTHSPLEQIEMIRGQQPLLNLIPHWITREHYSNPKPHPECYQLAIERFSNCFSSPNEGVTNEGVIGFEDTFRGLKALLSTSSPISVKGVLVSSIIGSDEVIQFSKQEGKELKHYSTFEKMNLDLD
jgi:beta-phosphoglucomutase